MFRWTAVLEADLMSVSIITENFGEKRQFFIVSAQH